MFFVLLVVLLHKDLEFFVADELPHIIHAQQGVRTVLIIVESGNQDPTQMHQITVYFGTYAHFVGIFWRFRFVEVVYIDAVITELGSCVCPYYCSGFALCALCSLFLLPTKPLKIVWVMDFVHQHTARSPTECGVALGAPHLVAPIDLEYIGMAVRARFCFLGNHFCGGDIVGVALVLDVAIRSQILVARGARPFRAHAALPLRAEKPTAFGIGAFPNIHGVGIGLANRVVIIAANTVVSVLEGLDLSSDLVLSVVEFFDFALDVLFLDFALDQILGGGEERDFVFVEDALTGFLVVLIHEFACECGAQESAGPFLGALGVHTFGDGLFQDVFLAAFAAGLEVAIEAFHWETRFAVIWLGANGAVACIFCYRFS